MEGLYPEIEPDASGRLDVGDGHLLHWEACGNPGGAPAIVLHGGPGAGCTPQARRYFDPARYRVVLFDQRGCGRSTPHAGDTPAALTANTTAHLLDDIERLRAHLGVESWLVFGGSWGSTLAVAYAQRHPERVRALVLRGLALTSRAEIDWAVRGAGAMLPEAYARFAGFVAREDTLEAYAEALADPARAQAAADSWCEWEMALAGAEAPPGSRWRDPRFRLGFARLVAHYWRHGAWLAEDELLLGAGKLAAIPGAIVHGSRDIVSRPETAIALAKAWKRARLHLIDGAGHDAAEAGMARALVAATNEFADRDPPAT